MKTLLKTLKKFQSEFFFICVYEIGNSSEDKSNRLFRHILKAKDSWQFSE